MLSETAVAKKARGAFFTQPAIAEFLVTWALAGNPSATILDPTCGEGAFLRAAGRELRRLGREASLDRQVFGIDLHRGSLDETGRQLEAEGLEGTLRAADFFAIAAPGEEGSPLPPVDAVVGNPPFVRYQLHSGTTRASAVAAALRQGVALSNLASSWAPLLVHAGSFLRPGGRLAMVLPAELLTVGYAEPVRRWLRERFGAVRLVVFGRLQFADALEDVVLVLANGTGGCDAFSLYHVRDAADLLHSPYTELAVSPAGDGKWTELLLAPQQRALYRRLTREHFVPLGSYGTPELGAVTGANDYFTLSDQARRSYGLTTSQLMAISPPGTRHLKGLSFDREHWRQLRDRGERVWLLHPHPDDSSAPLRRYIRRGVRLGIHDAYKCRVRTPWWRPPAVPPPDLFFTYMSHRYPRLINNEAGVSFVNSMHGIRLVDAAPQGARHALPLLALNSLSMLGAELEGRSYGGGILKMEPREARSLPVPAPDLLERAWAPLRSERPHLDRCLQSGRWQEAVERVDDVVLRELLGLRAGEIEALRSGAQLLRHRRLSRPGLGLDGRLSPSPVTALES